MVDGRRRCAVLGAPIGHSLSPAMHNAAFSYTGLNWRYLPLPVRPDRGEKAAGALLVAGA